MTTGHNTRDAPLNLQIEKKPEIGLIPLVTKSFLRITSCYYLLLTRSNKFIPTYYFVLLPITAIFFLRMPSCFYLLLPPSFQ